MRKLLTRTVALLLALCLVADPVTAQAFYTPAPIPSTLRLSQVVSRLTAEALVAPLVESPRKSFAIGLASLNIRRTRPERRQWSHYIRKTRFMIQRTLAAITAVLVPALAVASTGGAPDLAVKAASPALPAGATVIQTTTEYISYVIRRGDVLSKLSKLHGVSQEILQASSHIRNANHIIAGHTIRVPVEVPVMPSLPGPHLFPTFDQLMKVTPQPHAIWTYGDSVGSWLLSPYGALAIGAVVVVVAAIAIPFWISRQKKAAPPPATVIDEPRPTILRSTELEAISDISEGNEPVTLLRLTLAGEPTPVEGPAPKFKRSRASKLRLTLARRKDFNRMWRHIRFATYPSKDAALAAHTELIELLQPYKKAANGKKMNPWRLFIAGVEKPYVAVPVAVFNTEHPKYTLTPLKRPVPASKRTPVKVLPAVPMLSDHGLELLLDPGFKPFGHERAIARGIEQQKRTERESYTGPQELEDAFYAQEAARNAKPKRLTAATPEFSLTPSKPAADQPFALVQEVLYAVHNQLAFDFSANPMKDRMTLGLPFDAPAPVDVTAGIDDAVQLSKAKVLEEVPDIGVAGMSALPIATVPPAVHISEKEFIGGRVVPLTKRIVEAQKAGGSLVPLQAEYAALEQEWTSNGLSGSKIVALQMGMLQKQLGLAGTPEKKGKEERPNQNMWDVGKKIDALKKNIESKNGTREAWEADFATLTEEAAPFANHILNNKLSQVKTLLYGASAKPAVVIPAKPVQDKAPAVTAKKTQTEKTAAAAPSKSLMSRLTGLFQKKPAETNVDTIAEPASPAKAKTSLDAIDEVPTKAVSHGPQASAPRVASSPSKPGAVIPSTPHRALSVRDKFDGELDLIEGRYMTLRRPQESDIKNLEARLKDVLKSFSKKPNFTEEDVTAGEKRVAEIISAFKQRVEVDKNSPKNEPPAPPAIPSPVVEMPQPSENVAGGAAAMVSAETEAEKDSMEKFITDVQANDKPASLSDYFEYLKRFKTLLGGRSTVGLLGVDSNAKFALDTYGAKASEKSGVPMQKFPALIPAFGLLEQITPGQYTLESSKEWTNTWQSLLRNAVLNKYITEQLREQMLSATRPSLSLNKDLAPLERVYNEIRKAMKLAPEIALLQADIVNGQGSTMDVYTWSDRLKRLKLEAEDLKPPIMSVQLNYRGAINTIETQIAQAKDRLELDVSAIEDVPASGSMSPAVARILSDKVISIAGLTVLGLASWGLESARAASPHVQGAVIAAQAHAAVSQGQGWEVLGTSLILLLIIGGIYSQFHDEPFVKIGAGWAAGVVAILGPATALLSFGFSVGTSIGTPLVIFVGIPVIALLMLMILKALPTIGSTLAAFKPVASGSIKFSRTHVDRTQKIAARVQGLLDEINGTQSPIQFTVDRLSAKKDRFEAELHNEFNLSDDEWAPHNKLLQEALGALHKRIPEKIKQDVLSTTPSTGSSKVQKNGKAAAMNHTHLSVAAIIAAMFPYGVAILIAVSAVGLTYYFVTKWLTPRPFSDPHDLRYAA